MTKYGVMSNGKPAKYPECNVDRSWKNNVFNSFTKAEEYALKWLGSYAPSRGTIKLEVPFMYGGYGDYVEIIEYDIIT